MQKKFDKTKHLFMIKKLSLKNNKLIKKINKIN